jgi:O-antigen biosynthesis protein
MDKNLVRPHQNIPESIFDQPLLRQNANSGAGFDTKTMSIERPSPFSRLNDDAATSPVSKKHRVVVDGKVFRRGAERFRVRGATYGPFAPNRAGELLPEPAMVAVDFSKMHEIGINAIRIYHSPPSWFMDLAEEWRLYVMVDIPCPKHLDFLDDKETRSKARAKIIDSMKATAGRSFLLATSIGNEISPDVVRWYGEKRICSFLAELADVAREIDPDALLTYGNFPSTEYLELPFLDFPTFNVYLHDRIKFQQYLLRLANRVGDRPLLLGEIGMDTIRHSEEEQAAFLTGHLRETALLGIAGTFVFAWTDDWYVHGWQIDDWAFGITTKDRAPKLAYQALGKLFHSSPTKLFEETPRVSVVVCSYNGGRTLEKCLASLEKLDYPNYEVILVDDGSNDDTPSIAAKFPNITTIRQQNLGLSAARNVGMNAASGEIVAYTDSDCFADPDWLGLLIHQFAKTSAAAVGGPNLTPEDGWLAGCVAAAPGQPTHVLISDDEAEHIPGCNMAFRTSILKEIGGFDPVFRKAGDDVDICWRLMDAGHLVSFTPGAFVWHHRRQGPRPYFKQQAGYGEAEAMLASKHPSRFNVWGSGRWRGELYGAFLSGLRLGGPLINRGRFGRGLFQTVYQPGPAHWAMLPTTLEWHVIAIVFAIMAFAWQPAIAIVLFMMACTCAVVVGQSIQANIARSVDGLGARCVVALLCWLQPLVRSFARYRVWFRTQPQNTAPLANRLRFPHSRQVVRFLSQTGIDREQLLETSLRELASAGFHSIDHAGWTFDDYQIPCPPAYRLSISTAQEVYGGQSNQVCICYRLRCNPWFLALSAFACFLFAIAGLAFLTGITDPMGTWLIASGFGLLVSIAMVSGRMTARRVCGLFEKTATDLGYNLFTPTDYRRRA